MFTALDIVEASEGEKTRKFADFSPNPIFLKSNKPQENQGLVANENEKNQGLTISERGEFIGLAASDSFQKTIVGRALSEINKFIQKDEKNSISKEEFAAFTMDLPEGMKNRLKYENFEKYPVSILQNAINRQYDEARLAKLYNKGNKIDATLGFAIGIGSNIPDALITGMLAPISRVASIVASKGALKGAASAVIKKATTGTWLEKAAIDSVENLAIDLFAYHYFVNPSLEREGLEPEDLKTMAKFDIAAPFALRGLGRTISMFKKEKASANKNEVQPEKITTQSLNTQDLQDKAIDIARLQQYADSLEYGEKVLNQPIGRKSNEIHSGNITVTLPTQFKALNANLTKDLKWRYVVKEADELLTSHDIQGNLNKEYDQTLQPRNLSTLESQNKILKIAREFNPDMWIYNNASLKTGAPIIKNNMVEIGNGRMVAIKYLYDNNHPNAANFKQTMSDMGIDVSAFEKPVLLRERISEHEDWNNAVNEANKSDLGSYNVVEDANIDAEFLNLDLFVLYKGGEFTSANNAPMLSKFFSQATNPEELQKYYKNNKLTQRGEMRFKAAITQAAYEDSNLVSRIYDSTDADAVTVIDVLEKMAMPVASFRIMSKNNIVDSRFDISNHLASAANIIHAAKAQKMSFSMYIGNMDAFAKIDPLTEHIARLFYNNNGQGRMRQASDIKTVFKEYIDRAKDLGTQDTNLPENIVDTDPHKILNNITKENEKYQSVFTPTLELKDVDNIKIQPEKKDLETPEGALEYVNKIYNLETPEGALEYVNKKLLNEDFINCLNTD